MKIYQLPIEMVNALRSWFHPKDRSIILDDNTFIEGSEIVTPAHPTGPGNPPHNRGRLYWKNGCWTQLDEFGIERSFCSEWQDWSPVVTQSGNVTFTTTLARYMLFSNTVIVRARLGVTGAGTIGNAIIIGGLPYSAATVTGDIGTGRIVDASVPISYVGSANLQTATSFLIIADGNASGVGLTPAFALANGDVINFMVVYET